MRMLVKQSTWVLMAALLTLPQAASAQGHPQTRQGFWIGLGLGWGSLGGSGTTSRQSGGAGVLKLGGTITDQVLLGVESSVWTKKESSGGADARLTHGNVVFLGQFYPTAESGFFLQAGVGFSQLRADASSGGISASATTDGWGLTGGIGYDIRLGSNFSLSPYGLYSWGSFDGGDIDHFQLGAGVTWH